MKKHLTSKRFIISILALILNFIIFCVAIYLQCDLTSVGVGLTMLNSPLYVYLFGETIRKSEKTKLENE